MHTYIGAEEGVPQGLQQRITYDSTHNKQQTNKHTYEFNISNSTNDNNNNDNDDTNNNNKQPAPQRVWPIRPIPLLTLWISEGWTRA